MTGCEARPKGGGGGKEQKNERVKCSKIQGRRELQEANGGQVNKAEFRRTKGSQPARPQHPNREFHPGVALGATWSLRL